ncbi:hypothetical protein TWF106_008128 [Orbilia oligospora]|uniref:Uncharacterized protein n=1 Tax=Orbilia oligospora TaxID=2813651 RepID=A0A6G1MIA3_ORBOL|nr:hypothetical protein TWF679_009198 [Orbilia oligospora]KAF3216727.1 hypothetical protein TWF106_008128 [Orbilia oligospora]KAF3225998.1 hypothetical protein TWF191_005024 [Orbilia oligospora]KAF3259718.1 hypothetical protein TWF192_010573 [Orbilia oligospora]
MQLFSTIVLAAPLLMSVAMANPNVYDSYNANSNDYAPSNNYNSYNDKASNNNGYNNKAASNNGYDNKAANHNGYDNKAANNNGYNNKAANNNGYDNKAASNKAYDNGYDSKDTTANYGAKDSGSKYNSPAATSYEVDTRQHCIQEWFGTAPLCKGECPKGWRTIRTAKLADKCELSNDKKIVESCEMISKNICITGIKTLCEKCY